MRKVVILLGPPGSGKGTQAQNIQHKYGLVRISTGDILREAARNQTAFGIQAKKIMDAGKLVADDVMAGMISERIGQEDCSRGFILDGYPRTLPQAEILDKLLNKSFPDGYKLYALYIKTREEIVEKRFVGRRFCPNCGRIYNVFFQPSRRGDICDVCGGPLIRRSDDSEKIVNERLAVYKKQTEPLIDYYARRAALYEINGETEINAVFKKIAEILNTE